MNLNKGISTPIAILLIITVSAVVGVVVWQFATPTEQPTSKQAGDYTTQSACEEAGFYWYDGTCHEEERSEVTYQTYSNDKYQFEFPKGWKVSKEKKSKCALCGTAEFEEGYPVCGAHPYVSLVDGNRNLALEINPQNCKTDNQVDLPGGYYLCQKTSEDAVEKIKQSFKLNFSKEISNWKVYRNPDDGYKLKYPSQLSTEDITEEITNVEEGSQIIKFSDSVDKNSNITIYSYPNKDNLSLSELVTQFVERGKKGAVETVAGEETCQINLDGESSAQMLVYNQPPSDVSPTTQHMKIFATHNNTVYELSSPLYQYEFEGPGDLAEPSKVLVKEYVAKMLSTLEFTE